MSISVLPTSIIEDIKHPQWEQRLASVGFANMTSEIMIGDEKGWPVLPGSIGEIMVRGEAVMLGYWQNPDATAKTIRDNWLFTGDMGVMDGDGFLTLKDRSKDVIISGGSNIYPREVEEVLLSHPDLVEVSVIARPDREWGKSRLPMLSGKWKRQSLIAFVLTPWPVSNAPKPIYMCRNCRKTITVKF